MDAGETSAANPSPETGHSPMLCSTQASRGSGRHASRLRIAIWKTRWQRVLQYTSHCVFGTSDRIGLRLIWTCLPMILGGGTRQFGPLSNHSEVLLGAGKSTANQRIQASQLTLLYPLPSKSRLKYSGGNRNTGPGCMPTPTCPIPFG